jgi:hypothetical protein
MSESNSFESILQPTGYFSIPASALPGIGLEIYDTGGAERDPSFDWREAE